MGETEVTENQLRYVDGASVIRQYVFNRLDCQLFENWAYAIDVCYVLEQRVKVIAK
jgi:hypothetical protein